MQRGATRKALLFESNKATPKLQNTSFLHRVCVFLTTASSVTPTIATLPDSPTLDECNNSIKLSKYFTRGGETIVHPRIQSKKHIP